MRCRVLCALVVLAPAMGHADGIAIIGGSPRAIGRAGAATVGDDGGGALLINPAAMARRDTTRIELGASAIDDSLEWQTDAKGSPLSVGRAGSRSAPLGSVIGALDGWVIGLGAMTAAVVDRSLPHPSDAPPDDDAVENDLNHRYDYRYNGISGSYRRDTLVLGVARRLGDSLALGASFAVARVAVVERRRLWASSGGVAIGSPAGDVDLAFSASDPLSIGAVAGLLYAPAEVPIELGASVGWTRSVSLDGTVAAAQTAYGPAVIETATPTASLHLSQPLALRAGGRYVGDRLVVELDGDAWIAASGSDIAMWSVNGIRIDDPTHVEADVHHVMSRISQRSHIAVRGAVDVAVVPGFLWATAGYAFSTRATPISRMSPTFGDLGGHTLGLGIDTTAGGATITLGWSRTWAQQSYSSSALRLDSPFYGTDGAVPSGTYFGSIDQVGVLIDAEIGGK